MRRRQLFEFEDLAWCPAIVRDGGTNLLDVAFARIGMYDGVLPIVSDFVKAVDATDVLDLCSGGGGGALLLRHRLRAGGWTGTFVLSDRFPNASGRTRVAALADPATHYLADSVDAMDGGGDRPGVRTMASALHHFDPDAVRHLLTGLVARRVPFAIIDVAASPALRRMPTLVAPAAALINMVMLFGVALALTPVVRPVRLSSLLLTYVLPAIPLMVAWDGTASAFRAYTPEELLAIAASVPGTAGYEWQAVTRGRALVLTGRPR